MITGFERDPATLSSDRMPDPPERPPEPMPPDATELPAVPPELGPSAFPCEWSLVRPQALIEIIKPTSAVRGRRRLTTTGHFRR